MLPLSARGKSSGRKHDRYENSEKIVEVEEGADLASPVREKDLDDFQPVFASPKVIQAPVVKKSSKRDDDPKRGIKVASKVHGIRPNPHFRR